MSKVRGSEPVFEQVVDLLKSFEGALQSCARRDALPFDVYEGMVKHSKRVRRQLGKKYILTVYTVYGEEPEVHVGAKGAFEYDLAGAGVDVVVHYRGELCGGIKDV